jgi:hypothetical protein
MAMNVHGDDLVGAVLFNSPADKNRLLECIQNKHNITGKEEDLLNA